MTSERAGRVSRNLVLIVVHPDRLEARPPRPTVRAAAEPLKIGVDWSDNRDRWRSVALGRVVRIDGTTVPTRDPHPRFLAAEGNGVQEIEFRFLEPEDVLCRAELTAAPRSGGELVVGSLELWLLAPGLRDAGAPPARGGAAPWHKLLDK
jgi:hypothetical protein